MTSRTWRTLTPRRTSPRSATECSKADEAVASVSLDATFVARNTISLRWVYVHMIEEYARHNGHADLIRERIDGATGD